MNALVMAYLLALAADAPPADATAGLAGKWLVVYAEEGGRRNNTWEQLQATFQGDTLSYGPEGEKRSLRLKLGSGQTVEVTHGEGDKTQKGVCVVAQDYLCLSFGEAAKPRDGKKRASSSSFILILRRQAGGAK